MAARERKRKAEGKPSLEESASVPAETNAIEDDDANKRRKLLQEALELDKDDDSEEEKDAEKPENGSKASHSGDEDAYVVFESVFLLFKLMQILLAKEVMILTTRKRMTPPSYFVSSQKSNESVQKKKNVSNVNRMPMNRRLVKRKSPLRTHS